MAHFGDRAAWMAGRGWLLSIVTIVLAMTLMASAASADPITQTATIANQPSDWSSSLTFDKFDPGLGTLDGVQLQLDSNLISTITVESREAAPSTFNASVSGTVNVARPDNSLIVGATPYTSTSTNLGAFDGAVDFAGGSGHTAAGLTGTSSATTAGVLTASDQALFTGPGSITLPVTAQVRASENGPANLVARFNTTVGATANLTYDFAAPGSTGGGSGSFDTSGSAINDNLLPIGAVETASQIVAIADQTTGWSTTAAFQQFDPALGSLFSVNIELTSDVNAERGFENLGATSTLISTDQQATITIKLLDDKTILSVLTKLSGSVTLDAFDGAEDFAGSSGETVDGLTGSDTATGQIFDPTSLPAFIGDGTIDLLISALGQSFLEGPGNMLFDLAEEAGATIELRYVYLPGPATAVASVPEPVPLALLIFPLAGMALARRRRPR